MGSFSRYAVFAGTQCDHGYKSDVKASAANEFSSPPFSRVGDEEHRLRKARLYGGEAEALGFIRSV